MAMATRRRSNSRVDEATPRTSLAGNAAQPEPEVTVSKRLRWPKRLQFSCQLNLWRYLPKKRRKQEVEGKKSNNFYCVAVLPLSLFLPLSRTTVSYLKSSAAWETIPVEGNKVNSCQLRVTHESKTAFGLFMTARTRELQPSSYLRLCPAQPLCPWNS